MIKLGAIETLPYLADGKIIAYPTEGVYGLGCDPFNHMAVTKLLKLKNRKVDLGLILLIANWSQLASLIDETKLNYAALDKAQMFWKSSVTLIFPKSKLIPDWISGNHQSIAIRMTKHPVARKLCEKAPLVSTSANISGHLPGNNFLEIKEIFPQGIDIFVEGALGGEQKPSAIIDIISGEKIR